MTQRPFTAIYSVIAVILFSVLTIFVFSENVRARDPATNNAPPSTSDGTSSADLVHLATLHAVEDKLDQALQEASLAIQLDPRNVSALELRSSIYVQQKLWDRAESDVQAADKIQPDVAYKYKLGEIRYLAKDYGNARPRFVALQNDPRLGDLATYKVILCDLFGGHEAIAARDLATLDPRGNKPSFYFGQIAWSLVHNQRADANNRYAQAEKLYDAGTIERYVGAILEAQRLQLPTATFVTRDGRNFGHVHVSLEMDGLRVSTKDGWTTLPLDQLPDDLSSFPADIRDQIMRRRASATDQSSQSVLLTVTTKTGKKYEQLRWSVQEGGVAVLTTEGWITVPFDQLPEDLSAFPPEARATIAEKRQSPSSGTSQTGVVSFTSKPGKRYDRIQATTSSDGLVLLTANGRITVPFRDLPDDLSSFPAEWRPVIEERRRGTDSSETPSISFITRDGKHFDEARTSLAADGLRVLTSRGLVMVAFDQLPDDLSPFPDAWRTTILAGRTDTLKPATATNATGRNRTSDLHPPEARDCNFGTCVAVQGSTLVVGCRGAAYVYVDDHLEARLCPQPDSTDTGDPVTSVAVSHQTILTATSRGVFVWVRGNDGWELLTTLAVPGASAVAIDGDHLLVLVDGKGEAPNSVYFYERDGEGWRSVPHSSQHDKDTLSADRYGCVAALNGHEALIGVPDWSPASYLKGISAVSGQAYAARFDGMAWTEYASFQPLDFPTGANQFGAAVALSDDFAAISSTNHDTIKALPHHGTVYLFHRTANGWQQAAVLKSPSPKADAGFGCGPIALSHRTLAVSDGTVPANVDNVVLDTGEKSRKRGSIGNAGAVYIFTGPELQATLTAPDPADTLNHLGSPDRFAFSLALDGETLLVGAPGKNGGTGAVYVWKYEKDRWLLKDELSGFHKQLDFDY